VNKDNSLVRNWWVLPGFDIEVVATDLYLPVNLAFVMRPMDDPVI